MNTFGPYGKPRAKRCTWVSVGKTITIGADHIPEVRKMVPPRKLSAVNPPWQDSATAARLGGAGLAHRVRAGSQHDVLQGEILNDERFIPSGL